MIDGQEVAMATNEREASFEFQAPGGYRVGDPHPSSLPFAPGNYVHVGDSPELFVVVSFEGSTYRLRSQFGTELRAGRRAVRAARAGG